MTKGCQDRTLRMLVVLVMLAVLESFLDVHVNYSTIGDVVVHIAI